MKFFDKLKKVKATDPNEFWSRLSKKSGPDRQQFQQMTSEQLGELIGRAQAWYRQGISADRAGEIDIAREFYKQAFTLLPTHIEALDNYAIGLVEELKFSEAIPFFEKSAAAEPNSPLAFVYLVKCYEATGAKEESASCAKYLLHNWPDKSPYVNWDYLGKPKIKSLLAPPLEEGQVWGYKSRSCDEGSTIWIKLVERAADGTVIVHISVVDVCSPDNRLIFISHLPYDANALLGCLTSKLSSRQTWGREDDHFGDGYGTWFEAYQLGKAGFFSAPVSDVVQVILQSMSDHKK